MIGADDPTWPSTAVPLSTCHDSGEIPVGGTIGGRYEILGLIGDGGMGVVYRARQARVGREVAVKVLRRRFRGEQVIVQRFENEARLISQLRHPNTLRLYDCGRTPEGDLFIVTELLHGASLRTVLGGGPIPIERALSIAVQICASLSEAHGIGIVHRDLKPENVFLDRIGRDDLVKVLDFGLAKMVDAESVSTQTNSVLGTPAYMAPERVRAEPSDERSDCYALGVLLYEMITGKPPFTADTPVEILLEQVCDPPPPMSVPVPPELERLIMRMLAKDKEERPRTMDEVRGELIEIIRAQWIDLSPPSPPRPARPAEVVRQPAFLWTAATAVLAALALAFGGRPRTPEPPVAAAKPLLMWRVPAAPQELTTRPRQVRARPLGTVRVPAGKRAATARLISESPPRRSGSGA